MKVKVAPRRWPATGIWKKTSPPSGWCARPRAWAPTSFYWKCSPHFFAFMDWKAEYFKFAHPRRRQPDPCARRACAGVEDGAGQFFERANNAYYNTIMMIDDEGRELVYHQVRIDGSAGLLRKGLYRGRHRLQGLADKVRPSSGVGVCWDQWFPESWRAACA